MMVEHTHSASTPTRWQVWYRSPGEMTWRPYATYPFQKQAETICHRLTERMGDEAKVEAVQRA